MKLSYSKSRATMSVSDNQDHLQRIVELLPTHSERKAATKHLAFLDEQIANRMENGESTQIMRISRNYIEKMIRLSDAVRDAKVAINGGAKN
jgi:hypothetical protein